MEESIEDYIRISRNSKKKPINTAQKQNIRENAIVTLQKQKECQSRALGIVQLMIEGAVQPQIFLRCLRDLDQTYYQDIVEERTITNLCGYPLCPSKIQETRKGNYYINTRNNRVYDITDRKNYCSNYCYKASTHVKAQISESPLWLRDQEKVPEFQLLSPANRCAPGTEVITSPPRAESSFTSVFEFASASLNEVDETTRKSSRKSPNLSTIKENEIAVEKSRQDKFTSCKADLVTISEDDAVTEDVEEKVRSYSSEASTEALPKQTKLTKPRGKEKRKRKDDKNAFDEVEASVKEWITLETYIFLLGEAKVRQAIETSKLEEYVRSLEISKIATSQRVKYLEICKRLQLSEYESEAHGESRDVMPVPDYESLKQESESLGLKIKSFYSGSGYSEGADASGSKEGSSEDREAVPPVLPLVDLKMQRLRIFLAPLTKTTNNLLDLLDIPSDNVIPNLKLLAKTFKLEANNVVFRSKTWNLIAIILLKVLCICDDDLRGHLEMEKYKQLVKVMLDQYPNGSAFVDSLLKSIKDVNCYVEQYLSR